MCACVCVRWLSFWTSATLLFASIVHYCTFKSYGRCVVIFQPSFFNRRLLHGRFARYARHHRQQPHGRMSNVVPLASYSRAAVTNLEHEKNMTYPFLRKIELVAGSLRRHPRLVTSRARLSVDCWRPCYSVVPRWLMHGSVSWSIPSCKMFVP